jgi:signal transduction histidine kinase
VIIGVKDSGEGIAADKLSKLFQRFHQADDNQERRQQGSGLGLAICQELVEMHGGRIWVESTPGQGSNFRFTLPMGGSTTT